MTQESERKKDPAMAARIVRSMAIAQDKFGKNQTDIACEVGVSKQSVNKWRRTGAIARANLPTLAAACGVNIDWLATGKGSPEAANPFDQLSDNELVDAIMERLSPELQAQLLRRLAGQATIRRDNSE